MTQTVVCLPLINLRSLITKREGERVQTRRPSATNASTEPLQPPEGKQTEPRPRGAEGV